MSQHQQNSNAIVLDKLSPGPTSFCHPLHSSPSFSLYIPPQVPLLPSLVTPQNSPKRHRIMLSSSFPSSLTAATDLSSPPRHVRSRPTLISATARATSHPTASFYEILGIPAAASSLEIKAAYRRLARVCHPDAAAVTGDRNGSSAPAGDEFMKLHAAYSTLSDPEKRASYDRNLFRRRQQRPLTAATVTPASRFSGYGGRNWETDQCW